MGTRSLTHVKDEDDDILTTIYRQMDGYPSGMGAILAEFLRDRAVVNGFGTDTPEKASNGMGCLAASLVAELKDGIGGIYLYPPGSDDCGEAYTYTVYFVKDAEGPFGGSVALLAESNEGGYSGKPRTRKVLYNGKPEGFDAESLERTLRA